MGYSSSQAKEFINHIAPIIKAEADKRGYKICSTVIAQAIIEGSAGTSKLAKNYHNHFGLKAGKAWVSAGKPTVNMKTMEEYTVGKMTQIVDGFRVYSDDVEGVKGYYDFVNTKRYQNLKTAVDYAQYAQYLKNDGYATSSSYVNTLTSTVKKYGLDKYDGYISYYPIYSGTSESVDEVLRSVGVSEEYLGSYINRRPVAEAQGILNYTGTGSQNTRLKDLARRGALRKV